MPEYSGLFREMPVNASGMDFTLKCRHFPNPAFFRYCTTPSRGLCAGGLRLKATVQKVYGKRMDKDDSVKKNVQEALKEV